MQRIIRSCRYDEKAIGFKFLFYLCFCFILSSCSDTYDGENHLNGELTTISLKVMGEESQEINTRAFNESAVLDMHILIYNSKGELVTKRYVPSNSLTLITRSGNGNSIYAIANTNNPSLFNGDVASTTAKLQTMLAATISDINGIKNQGDRLLMSGLVQNITIKGGSHIQAISGLVVKRLAAKVNFNVVAPNGVILKYRIRNIPNSSYLIAHPNPNEDSPTDAAIGADGIYNWFSTGDVAVNAPSFSSSYYMYENRRGGRVPAGAGTLTNQQKKAKYAPAYATCLEVDANIESSSYTYKIYLGADNSSNYSIKRNGNYSYTITLKPSKQSDTRVDLKVRESNCYMLTPGNSILIPVSRANADGIIRLPSLTSGWTADLLWTDNPNGLSSAGAVEFVNAQQSSAGIWVKAGTAEGNAVVVVRKDGIIAWSWHIWVTNYAPVANKIASNQPNKTTFAYNNFLWLDRNLGATSATMGQVSSLGFYYQWGRKDPFPGADRIKDPVNQIPIYGPSRNLLSVSYVPVPAKSNLNNSINNPLTYYPSDGPLYDWYTNSTSPSDENGSLWGGEYGVAPSPKTVYDPCPVGWRVPTYLNGVDPWHDFTHAWNNQYTGENWGSVLGWYPASGLRFELNGNIQEVGGRGLYWTAYASGSTVSYLNIQADMTFNNSAYRAWGFPVRCVQEW